MNITQENTTLSSEGFEEVSCQENCCENSNSQEVSGAQYEETTFATLLALVPLLVFTFLGQVGLF
jgi:hypothetical protein